MAGAGYKLFNTGDVLTAAQVNTYLQEQVVMVFANAAARTTALSGVLAEGMVSYLKDTDALEIYSGAAWVGYGSGDITGVTAGTGITGGGTSGSVTITNSMATEITAAGDIIVGTGSGTFDNLPIGTTGQVLTADTTVSPYKVKWATAAGGGKLLQMVSTTYSTEATNTTSSWADSGISLSITPTSATSKILIKLHMGRCSTNTSSIYSVWQGRFVRGSTTIYSDIWGLYSETSMNRFMSVDAFYLDSPATTSATTYKLQFVDSGNGSNAKCQLSGAQSNFILMEIGA